MERFFIGSTSPGDRQEVRMHKDLPNLPVSGQQTENVPFKERVVGMSRLSCRSAMALIYIYRCRGGKLTQRELIMRVVLTLIFVIQKTRGTVSGFLMHAGSSDAVNYYFSSSVIRG